MGGYFRGIDLMRRVKSTPGWEESWKFRGSPICCYAHAFGFLEKKKTLENDVKLIRCVLGMTLNSFVAVQGMAVNLRQRLLFQWCGKRCFESRKVCRWFVNLTWLAFLNVYCDTVTVTPDQIIFMIIIIIIKFSVGLLRNRTGRKFNPRIGIWSNVKDKKTAKIINSNISIDLKSIEQTITFACLVISHHDSLVRAQTIHLK